MATTHTTRSTKTRPTRKKNKATPAARAAPTGAAAPAPGLPRIQRRKSKLHGWGVFAREPINKNKRIIDYAGELITNKQSENREDRYLRKGCIWVFRVNRYWSRDANVGGNVARFINHACKTNCWVDVVDKTIWIRAARRIEPGEELTYDYNTEGDKTIPCRCRPNCKTRL
ncbi:MAG TPA: SET domain-containing protein-lysine N-methyltransferase [Vicinamibacterales bacterium]|nr:SET domain-containing protein-lysine N-methyltransferase [Vicinamibacterales bacterium]